MDSPTIKILLVEDNPADADLLSEFLEEADETQWSLVHVEKLKEALQTLRENHFDVILLDLSLPDKQGLATVVQTHETAPDLPIVVLTGLNDRVTALDAVRQGAQDYLVKGKIDSNLLVRAIGYAIERSNTLKQLRQSEEQLQRLNEELEHRVKEQTEELRDKNRCLQSEITERQRLEEELRNALMKEKELSDLKSNIISVVSHEYRTPLATILSSTELLENYSHKWDQEKRQRHFKRIENSVHHLTQLVNDVLIISKAEAGKLDFNPVPLELVEFCYQLVEELQLTASTQHNISFLCQTSSIKACLDEKLLRQFLTNLLSNAIKYSPHGGNVQLELECKQDVTIFRIRDQGIGIPLKDQDQLFEAFHRSSNVGTISGTGLGLAIVKKCVDIHNGQIAVESEVGTGTTFIITIPLICQVTEQLAESNSQSVY
ncbi:hybrid sensor histidine kinase/response regulator [Microcoleus sp. FACHB-SPT15]|uniref:hybrid sensor histidine kinase/response regulator n=1 Tax=Microcoleus sp. FACHB-SPT15 TaxID=2692830 RepID=UPI0017830D39|nr:hybrid sensor histidine kinase/response regulator [Microcoleus sp. FACHB-SPT15]MBD1808485.1 hybrid sensor histidine kinase/response regulator [Microcoleus sp. FACHB-SPT15]